MAFGLWVQRALAWGLAYVLIWEGAVASAGAGLTRLSIRGYTRSLLAEWAPGDQVVRYGVGGGVAVAVLVGVAAAGLVLARRRLDTADVA